jgi:hypothetical protein
VTDKDDSSGRRNGGFDDTDNVGNGQAREQRPHGEVLEAGGGRRELVTESVVLHVDADKIVESGSREAENARDFLGVEEVGGLVPVDPHATEVVAKKVVKGISRKEAQAVGDPVCLAGVVVVVGLCASSQLADCLGTLLVCARPDAEGDTVKSVGGVLLEDE